MDCCLWLNRKKISSAAEIVDNFDLAAVRGYFLGGSLSEWLREHGGTVYADRLDKLRTLDPQDPQLNDRLAEVFGGSAGAVTGGFCGNVPDNGGSRCGSFGSFSGGFRGGSGSFNFGSYGVFQGSGLGIGSGGLTALGSYRFSLWEWEWEWRFVGRGSFLRFVRFVWLVSVRFWELSSRLFRELSVGELFRLVRRGKLWRVRLRRIHHR